MPSLLPLAAPIALFLPLLGQGSALLLGEGETKPDHEQPPEASSTLVQTESDPLNAFYDSQVAHQVRIERRVTIRISPRPPSNRNELFARLPQNGLRATWEEREMDRCVPVAGIVGVQTGNGNRLLLFLSDDRIVTINLERACRARDFYSGFYVERNEDGRLCVDRDQLQSRSGAKCEIERMRQLVAVEE